MRSQPYANSANGRGPPEARGTGIKGKDLGDPIRSGPGCAHNTHAPCRSGWLPPPTRRHFITGPVVQPFLLSKPPTQRLGKAGPMVQPSYSKPPTQRHLGIGPVMRPVTFSKPPTRRKTGGQLIASRLHGGSFPVPWDPGSLPAFIASRLFGGSFPATLREACRASFSLLGARHRHQAWPEIPSPSHEACPLPRTSNINVHDV